MIISQRLWQQRRLKFEIELFYLLLIEQLIFIFVITRRLIIDH